MGFGIDKKKKTNVEILEWEGAVLKAVHQVPKAAQPCAKKSDNVAGSFLVTHALCWNSRQNHFSLVFNESILLREKQKMVSI